jgi:hypothetical protein
MIAARYPLSPGQQGMWFAEQPSDTAYAYHDHEFFRLTGRLDRPAFRAAVEHVVDRHEVLRTRFVTLSGNPQQVVDDRWHGQVRVQLVPPDAAQVGAFAQEVTRRPLDLEEGPLFLVDLLALGDKEHHGAPRQAISEEARRAGSAAPSSQGSAAHADPPPAP